MHNVKINSLICLILSVFACKIAFAEDDNIRSLSCGDLHTLMSRPAAKIAVVDVRSETEFAKEHIPGAVNVLLGRPLGQEVGRDSVVVVYCGNQSCPNSLVAAKMFADSAYSNVLSLEGGLAAWKKAGFNTEGSSVSTGGGTDSRSFITAEELGPVLHSAGYYIVDLRTEKEYLAGHITGAVNVPFDGLASSADSFPKGKTIVIYDRNGLNARTGASQVKSRGFSAVWLAGGLAGWAGKKLPMASGSGKQP